MLPKYKFQRTGSFAKAGADMAGPSGGVLSILGATVGAAEERALPAEDAVNHTFLHMNKMINIYPYLFSESAMSI